ncbi:MAG: hypothetical protein NZ899_00620 [Thermoguttaceae bacterium]|nr:hypothetical protein [Thermoguttaceae bacterium]MDW8077398.1 hypothetical protein [Thermoguttaceae bacterium]
MPAAKSVGEEDRLATAELPAAPAEGGLLKHEGATGETSTEARLPDEGAGSSPYRRPAASLDAGQQPRPYPLASPERASQPELSRQTVSRGPSGQSPEAAFAIQLSAGVALPQLLPTGTAMGFSVDYRWVQGEPEPNAPYFWVIESAGAPPVRQPVRLDRQGTLQGFVLDLRPEHGPFQTYLTDRVGRRLSPTIPLR